MLLACTLSGTITFVSKLYTGNISDKNIVSKSGFLHLIKPEDNVVADCGFLIRDLLAIRGATLNIPPFSHGKQLSMHATTLTRRIARARIVVERAIGRLKEFQMLQGNIPMNTLSTIDAAINVAACLSNMQPCLCSD